jgi:hypothetical protein
MKTTEQSKSVTLREWKLSDAAALANLLNNKKVLDMKIYSLIK